MWKKCEGFIFRENHCTWFRNKFRTLLIDFRSCKMLVAKDFWNITYFNIFSQISLFKPFYLWTGKSDFHFWPTIWKVTLSTLGNYKIWNCNNVNSPHIRWTTSHIHSLTVVANVRKTTLAQKRAPWRTTSMSYIHCPYPHLPCASFLWS